MPAANDEPVDSLDAQAADTEEAPSDDQDDVADSIDAPAADSVAENRATISDTELSEDDWESGGDETRSDSTVEVPSDRALEPAGLGGRLEGRAAMDAPASASIEERRATIDLVGPSSSSPAVLGSLAARSAMDAPSTDSATEARATIAADSELLPDVRAQRSAGANVRSASGLGFTPGDFGSSAPLASPAFSQDVARFQEQHGLVVDGIAGPRTMGALRAGDVAPAIAPVQSRASGAPSLVQDVQAVAARGVSGAGQALPHLDRIQRSFGAHDVGGVRAHLGGAAGEAAEAIGSVAYATGSNVAFASAPDVHTAAHEAAHVVQQRGGVQLKSGVGEVGDAYEQHADQVADLVVRGESAEALLGAGLGLSHAAGPALGVTGPVQRKQTVPQPPASQPVVSDNDIAVATSLTTGFANAVVPNDRKQQEHALLGITDPEQLLRADSGLVQQIQAIATQRARRFRRKPSRQAGEHRNVVRGANVAAGVAHGDRGFQNQVRRVAEDSAGRRLRETVAANLQTGSAGSAGPTVLNRGGAHDRSIADSASHAAEVTKHTRALLIEEEHKRLRGKFLLWAGRLMHERSPGKPALKRLRAAERSLVRRLSGQRKPPVEIQMRVWELRKQHASRFRPKVALIKKRFLVAARNEQRFRFDPQPRTRAHGPVRAPRNDPRGITTVGATGGIITGRSNLKVANAAVDFARALRARWRGRITIDTYPGHSQGAYSIDVQPWIQRDARGFYDPVKMKLLFALIEQAATVANVRWKALYGDFDVAKSANQRFRTRKVGFQWEHGPAPFVLHVHLDVVPK